MSHAPVSAGNGPVKLAPVGVAAVAATAAAGFGVAARAGRLDARHRWVHHALFATAVVATVASLPSGVRVGSHRRIATIAAGACLGALPATVGGSSRHIAVGAAAVTALTGAAALGR